MNVFSDIRLRLYDMLGMFGKGYLFYCIYLLIVVVFLLTLGTWCCRTSSFGFRSKCLYTSKTGVFSLQGYLILLKIDPVSTCTLNKDLVGNSNVLLSDDSKDQLARLPLQ